MKMVKVKGIHDENHNVEPYSRNEIKAINDI